MEGRDVEVGPSLPTPADVITKLEDGTISPEDALQLFWKLDQSFTDTPGVLRALQDPRVEQAFSSDTLAPDYYNLLSVAALHQGRALAYVGEDPLPYFKQSLEAAQRVETYEEGVPEAHEWTLYIEANCAYFERDLPRLEEISKNMPGTYMNAPIVRMLCEGLRTRGDIDYVADLRPG